MIFHENKMAPGPFLEFWVFLTWSNFKFLVIILRLKERVRKRRKKKRWSNSYNLLGSVIIFWQVYTKRVETPRACLRSSYWLWLTLKCVTTNSIILSTLAEETRQTAGWQTTVKTAERCRGEAKLGRLLRSCCVTTGCIHLRCCLLTNWDKWGWPRDVKKKIQANAHQLLTFPNESKTEILSKLFSKWISR